MKFIGIYVPADNTKILSLDSGKYQYKPAKEIPDEYLDWVIDNYSKRSNIQDLLTARTALEVKITRLSKALDLSIQDYEIPLVELINETPDVKQERKLIFRKRKKS